MAAAIAPKAGTCRREVARFRLPGVRAHLAACRLCAHECCANRLAGARGPCGVGLDCRVFGSQVEVSDERELAPVFSLALSGCDLRCDFCITGAESWNARAGTPLDVTAAGSAARRAVAGGARSIMVLGGEPTVHLPQVLELVSVLPGSVPWVWKTNGHGSRWAREALEGLFDIWVVDYKFGNRHCAERLAGVPDYVGVVQENLRAVRAERIVRHLLMPGHVDCCWRPVAAWLGEHLPGVKVNLRTGFWPAWRAARHPELLRGVQRGEAEAAWEIARAMGLRMIE